MTTEQTALLRAANLQLRLAALTYAYRLRDSGEDVIDEAKRSLYVAAREFVAALDASEPHEATSETPNDA